MVLRYDFEPSGITDAALPQRQHAHIRMLPQGSALILPERVAGPVELFLQCQHSDIHRKSCG